MYDGTILTVLSTICVSLISLIGIVITTITGNNRIRHELEKHNAIQDTKIDELTRVVREHNNFAAKLPVLEERVNSLERKINDLKT